MKIKQQSPRRRLSVQSQKWERSDYPSKRDIYWNNTRSTTNCYVQHLMIPGLVSPSKVYSKVPCWYKPAPVSMATNTSAEQLSALGVCVMYVPAWSRSPSLDKSRIRIRISSVRVAVRTILEKCPLGIYTPGSRNTKIQDRTSEEERSARICMAKHLDRFLERLVRKGETCLCISTSTLSKVPPESGLCGDEAVSVRFEATVVFKSHR